MKLLMPSHAKRVKQYADPVPLFQRYGAEDQLDAMYDPVRCTLKSGGYLVINPTEALVSIDINSGRATHGARYRGDSAQHQPRGRATRSPASCACATWPGLIVIDFIDMEYGSNVRKVEKTMKDALRERPRAHSGRPHFGLRPDGNEPPAPAHRRAGGYHPRLPALRWFGSGPHRVVCRAFGAAHDRGRGCQGQRHDHHALCQPGSGDLCAQCQACRSRRDRDALTASRSR